MSICVQNFLVSLRPCQEKELGGGRGVVLQGAFKVCSGRQAAQLLVPRYFCFFTYIYSCLFLTGEKGLAEPMKRGSSFESVLL